MGGGEVIAVRGRSDAMGSPFGFGYRKRGGGRGGVSSKDPPVGAIWKPKEGSSGICVKSLGSQCVNEVAGLYRFG